MSADNRSVFTDALETLGTIITEKEKRDAIHLAVEPVIAGQILGPGEHIGIMDGKAYGSKPGLKLIGIVDPFIMTGLEEGDRFWMVIYPRKINSLRHVWSHPDLPDTVDIEPPLSRSKEVSREFIRNYISQNCGEDPDEKPYEGHGEEYGLTKQAEPTIYDCVVETASRSTDRDNLHFGFTIYGRLTDEFWEHIGVLTDQYIPATMRAQSISCSC